LPEPRALQPWDDEELPARLLALVPTLERSSLRSLRPADIPAMPGAYLQFIAAPWLAPIFGELVASGRQIFYVGVAKDLRVRMARYRLSVDRMSALNADDLFVALLPTSSLASGSFCESALLSALRPVTNQICGWGSQSPGCQRSGQKISGTDSISPHWWSRQASLLDVARARLKVAAHLARLPDQPSWPPLLPAATGTGPAEPAPAEQHPDLRLICGGTALRRSKPRRAGPAQPTTTT